MAIEVSVRRIRGPLPGKVRAISGQDANLCFQCGLCAGSCPMAEHMAVPTRRMMHMLQLGMVDEAAASGMARLCASCHTCQARCPRGIEIPRIVEALRQLVLRGGTDLLAPESIPKPLVRDLPQAAMVAGLRKLTG